MGSRVAWTILPLLALCGVGGLAWAGASWSGQPYILNIPAHLTGRGGTVNSTLTIDLAHDLPCSITISAPPNNAEVLTHGAATLITKYKFSGQALAPGNADADWVDSSFFVGHVYSVQGNGGSDQFTLAVQGTSPADRAVPAGTYTATLTLTVAW